MSKRNHRQTNIRWCSGNILALSTVLGMCLSVFIVWAFLVGIFMHAQHRVEMASEAAALAAANTASNVVINDQHFGYVSLTDWPAGKATLNPHGDPMPVTGINTVIATCRFNMLVAQKLNNQDMIKMAQNDAKLSAQTGIALNQAISNALDQSAAKPLDKDGNQVDAYQAAKAAFLSDMPLTDSKIQLKSLKLSLGYLDTGCGSSTAAAQPLSMSQTDDTTAPGGFYNAFVDVAAGGQDYYFAGLLSRTGLVKHDGFHADDASRPCSIVRAQCQVHFSEADTGRRPLAINVDSCAVPGANPDLVPPTVLALKVDQNLLASFHDWTSLLSFNQRQTYQALLKRVQGGDYPSTTATPQIDPQFSPDGESTIGELAAKGLYDWLRTCHGKAHIDTIVNKMIPQQFPAPVGGAGYLFLTYDINTTDGSLVCQNLQSFPWSSDIVHDEEDFSDYPPAGKPSPNIYFLDEVTRLGRDGGLHGGQALVDALSTNPFQRVYPPNGLGVQVELDQ